jgi:hypothetical protein
LMGVPDRHVGLFGELTDGEPVSAHRRGYRGPSLLGRVAVVPARDLHAGGEPLDVPFEGSGVGLVDVVDVEDEAPLG